MKSLFFFTPVSLLLVLTLVACEKEQTLPPTLGAKGTPQGKYPLFQETGIQVSSSSLGQARITRDGKTVQKDDLEEGKTRIIWKQRKKPGRYQLFLRNEDGLTWKSISWRVRYPTLEMGSRGRDVEMLHQGLRKMGYLNAPRGSTWNEYTTLAVLAFRKTNGLGFQAKASPEVLRMLLLEQGSFPLREKKDGKYVEVDLSKQVMVLAKDGKPQYTYHISSGEPSTPSDLGRYTFYMKAPGYNSIGMYYSVFYNKGEATHGYPSVPDYPASHGCIRNPIPSSVQIYNWIPLGSSIWVY